MAESLEFSVDDAWEKASKDSWRKFILETARDSDGVLYHKNKGSNVAYKQSGDGFVCTECGSEIQATTVAHPIWDGPFSCSGSGKVQNETVPYCPNCEKKPDYSGSPIQVKF